MKNKKVRKPGKRNEFCQRSHDMTQTRRTQPNGDTYCSECKRLNTKKAYYKNPTKFAGYRKKSRLKTKYCLTLEQWEQLFLHQNKQCAICGSSEPNGRGWNIDHDHSCCPGGRSCGKCIRGILCHSCNTGIGRFKDDIEIIKRAIKFLK